MRVAFEDSVVVESIEGIRLRRRRFPMSTEPVAVHNASDGFKLIMPTSHGRVRLDDDGRNLFEGSIRPGTVRFVQPDEHAQFTPLTTVDELMLDIPGPIFRRQASVQGLDVDGSTCPELLPVADMNHAVQRLVPLLDLAIRTASKRSQNLIQGLATTLMSLLLDVDLHRSHPVEHALDDAQFEQILRFADARLSQHLDLAEWADAVGLSPGDFARRFQQHTGVAPYTWFLDRRIDEAKRLMAQTSLPLVEVALDAGFCSQSHFTEAFRRRVGTSPGRWRKTQVQNT